MTLVRVAGGCRPAWFSSVTSSSRIAITSSGMRNVVSGVTLGPASKSGVPAGREPVQLEPLPGRRPVYLVVDAAPRALVPVAGEHGRDDFGFRHAAPSDEFRIVPLRHHFFLLGLPGGFFGAAATGL
jgi:hypothetical protein